jgi:cytidylate kinase
MTDPLIVAIDGPAGSGKSTVARALAEKLDVEVLDTGAMYRAVTVLALRDGLDLHDADKVARVAEDAELEMGARVVAHGVDLTDELRTPEVNDAVSIVAAHPGVRRALVAQQRAWAVGRDGAIVEGRDMGTVVFPDARVKVFLTASHAERARRRVEEPAASVERRDTLDEGREASPLRPADDAHVLDTTDRPIDGVVDEILALV